jgi:hypothetical protein
LRDLFGGKGLLKIVLFSREISYIIGKIFFVCLKTLNLACYKKRRAPHFYGARIGSAIVHYALPGIPGSAVEQALRPGRRLILSHL